MYLDLIVWPFLAALVISGIHTYLGWHVVTRGVIFVDLALAQVAALGTAVGLLIGLGPTSVYTYVLAVGFTLIGAALFAGIRTLPDRIPQEAIIGITYVVSAALMILLFSKSAEGAEEINHLLVGSILFVTPLVVGKMFVLYTVIGLFHWRYRSRFMATSRGVQGKFAPEFNVKLWDFLFYVTFGIIVTFSVRIAGVLLVFSYLIIPTVAALYYQERPLSILIFGWLFSVVASILGMIFSLVLDIPTGAAIVVTFGLLLMVNGGLFSFLNRKTAT